MIMKNRKYWSGAKRNRLQENEVFAYDNNVLLSSRLNCPYYYPKMMNV